MTIKKFSLFWLLDYIVSSVSLLVLAYVFIGALNLSGLRSMLYLLIPISTIAFSYLAYRGVQTEKAHRFFVALSWVLGSIVVDAIWLAVFYDVAVFDVLFGSIPLVLYVSKFIAVFIGAWLGLHGRSDVVLQNQIQGQINAPN